MSERYDCPIYESASALHADRLWLAKIHEPTGGLLRPILLLAQSTRPQYASICIGGDMNEQDLRNALQIALRPQKPRKGKERTIQAACMNGGNAEKRDARLTATPNGISTLVASTLAPGQVASVAC